MNTKRAIFIGTNNDRINYGQTGDINFDEFNAVSGVETVLFEADGLGEALSIEKNHLYIPD